MHQSDLDLPQGKAPDDPGDLNNPLGIRYNYIVAFPPQAELNALWLMANDFKPEIGYEFTLRTNPLKHKAKS